MRELWGELGRGGAQEGWEV
jgi:hypothetical protein